MAEYAQWVAERKDVMVNRLGRLSPFIVGIAVLVAVAVLGLNTTRAQLKQQPETAASTDGDFVLFESPQATLLLDRRSGDLWRVGYTEVGGHHYWFSTYVPREPVTSFKEFQNRLRKEIRTAPKE